MLARSIVVLVGLLPNLVLANPLDLQNIDNHQELRRVQNEATALIRDPIRTANLLVLRWREANNTGWESGWLDALKALDLAAYYVQMGEHPLRDSHLAHYHDALAVRLNKSPGELGDDIQYIQADTSRAAKALKEFASIFFNGILERDEPRNLQLVKRLLETKRDAWSQLVMKYVFANRRATPALLVKSRESLDPKYAAEAHDILMDRPDRAKILKIVAQDLEDLAKQNGECDQALLVAKISFE